MDREEVKLPSPKHLFITANTAEKMMIDNIIIIIIV